MSPTATILKSVSASMLITSFGKEFLGAEEMAQHLRALNHFSEDPD